MIEIENTNSSEVVAVCIPTRGREKWLKRLLYSIERQNFDREVIVIVSDNDVKNRVGTKVVEELRQEGYRWDIQVVFAPKPCMSCAWNTVFNYACNLDVEYLAMIDDDEIANEFWLNSFLLALKQLEVDVIGGAVIQHKKNNTPFAKHYNELVVNNYFIDTRKGKFYRLYKPTMGSGNFLIKRNVIAKFLPSPTSDEYDDFGGGDTEMFMKIMNDGYKFGFSEEALCWEEVSEERESLRQSINFLFSVGQRRAAVDFNNKYSKFKVIRAMLDHLIRSLIRMPRALFYLIFKFQIRFDLLKHWIILFMYISYFVGFRSKFYIKDSNSSR